MSDITADLRAMMKELQARFPPAPEASAVHPADRGYLPYPGNDPPFVLPMAVYITPRVPCGNAVMGTHEHIKRLLGLCFCCGGDREDWQTPQDDAPWPICDRCAAAGCHYHAATCQRFVPQASPP